MMFYCNCIYYVTVSISAVTVPVSTALCGSQFSITIYSQYVSVSSELSTLKRGKRGILLIFLNAPTMG